MSANTMPETELENEGCILTTRDLFLTSEERYDVWRVKAAERPELLEVHEEAANHNEVLEDEKKSSDDVDHVVHANNVDGDASNDEGMKTGETEDDDNYGDKVLPLTDGCDIPNWRRECLVNGGKVSIKQCQDDWRNVGLGCPLLRRDSCLPIPHSVRLSVSRNVSAITTAPSTPWQALKQHLLEQVPDHRQAPRIQYQESNTCHPLVFEMENRPVVINGCETTWHAMESCRFASLVQRFGHLKWRFSDTHGETMTLRAYQKYIHTAEGADDDAPLAVYDSQFGSDERQVILSEYTVPTCFDYDLFEYLEREHDDETGANQLDEVVDDDDGTTPTDGVPADEERPPYRWILIGPERSGTGLHVDPIGTHAWVTLLEGCKRWVLFPPNTDRSAIHMQTPQIPSVIWFRDYYAQLIDTIPGAIEVLQRPGETVYVPAGWPHLVLNLELSTAITHNYASEYPSIQQLHHEVLQAEPSTAQRLRAVLKRHRSDLYQQLDCCS